MASGWNLWVWLECIGVVIIIVTFPYSTCISSFFDSSIPISLFIFKMFFRSLLYRFPHNNYYILLYIYSTYIYILALFLQQHTYVFVLVYVTFVQFSKRCSKNIRDRSKIEITGTWRYNYINSNARVPRLPRARYRVTFQESYS